MKYYLETNALRSLSKDFYKSENITNCFTSGLSIVELISGLNENEYYIRRKVLCNLINSNIDIDWELPDGIIGSAFPVISGIEYRIDDLKKICQIIIETQIYDIAYKKIQDNTKYNLKYFSELDKVIPKIFIEATITGNIEISKVLSENKLEELKLSEDDLVENNLDLLNLYNTKHFNINYSIMINSIARRFARMIYPDDEVKQKIVETDIYNSYNHSIDHYIVAYSYYTIEKIKYKAIPAKNDIFDLQHLLYLKSYEDHKIVTNDNLLVKLCRHLFPGYLITIDEFLVEYRRNCI